jgi:hypothetical protein
MAGDHGVLREIRDEVLNGRFGIQSDLDRVGADERAAEDPAGQLGDVVALERLENADGNLGGVGDLAQLHTAALASVAKPSAKAAGRALRSHTDAVPEYVRKWS